MTHFYLISDSRHSALKARIDAVEEIMSTYSAKLTVLRNVLKGLPDLARGLCRIQYGKVSASALCDISLRLSHLDSVHSSRTGNSSPCV